MRSNLAAWLAATALWFWDAIQNLQSDLSWLGRRLRKGWLPLLVWV